jgi:hypothetical protein
MMAQGRRAGLAVLGASLALGIWVVPARAQQQPAFSFNVKPVRLVLPAGTAHTVQTVTVTNGGLEPLHIDVAVVEFSQAPDGRLNLVRPGVFSAASWVDPQPGAFDLTPGHRQEVSVSISRPAEPEPGERQVAVIFRVPAQAAGGNIAISRAIAVELLINVPGPVIHQDQIGSVLMPRFLESGPVPIRVQVRNLGNVHQDYIASSRLVATVPDGHQIQFPDFTVLRESTREVEADWLNPPLICVCKVTVTGDDGNGHLLAAQADVIVFPFRTVAGLLLAAAGLFILRKQLRRRQRRMAAARLEYETNKAYYQARRDLRRQ